ncbi:MAG: DUF3405 domain-containing protein [Pseudomonadales bacterium]|nr:DUF3405 domain-containing protein [Pseudomonadales bacterium]
MRQFVFNRDDLESLGYPGKQNLTLEHAGKRNMKLGNAELPVMLFKAAHPEYEYYWVVEYDVRFSGNWRLFFSHFAENNADLLGTTLSSYLECPGWSHWSSVNIKVFDLSNTDLIRGFFPVYRISRQALECLDKAYQKECSGHMESLMPSLLYHSGMRLEDFGGSGTFVAADNKNKFYTNNPLDNTLAPGTFIYRPWFTEPGEQRNILWHPVKAPVHPLIVRLKSLFRTLFRRK